MQRLLAIIVLLSAVPWGARAEKRVALLVGHPFGGEGLTPLRYVANDVDRLAEVLGMMGGFAPEDILVSYGEDAAEVNDRFQEAQERIRHHDTLTGERPLFLFYYSGHAQNGELRLGDTRLPLMDVKEMVEKTRASVRLALFDSCRSGAITRLKGAIKGAPITMSVDDAGSQRGTVLITASSAREDAQESDDIQGSFFTHYLTSGLRGAADRNDDGIVTLSEAYNHAYASTVARTIGTRGGIQHPTFRFDLRGTGDVVLTRLGEPHSGIEFPQDLGGHFVVFDLERQVVVAEFQKEPDRAARLALKPGRYVIKKRETDHLKMQRLRVAPRGFAPVDPRHMERVAFADDYAKGAIISVEDIIHGVVGIRLSGGFGGQLFLSAPARVEYFPTLGVFNLALDFDNLLRRHLGLRLDLGFGSSGERDLSLNDDYLGELSYRVRINQLTTGLALTGSYPVTDFLDVGAQARIGLIVVSRQFVDVDLPDQGFSTLTPGLGLEAALRITQWLRVGVHVRFNYIFFNVDEPLSLAYVDGGLVITAVLR